MSYESRLFEHFDFFVNNNVPKKELVLCMGPMFSGKTTLLYKAYMKIKTLKNDTIKILVINHSNDVRENSDVISSHNKDISGCLPCVKTKNLCSKKVFDFIEDYTNEYMILFIDESQFFNDLGDAVRKIFENYNNKKIFICCFGLNSNFKREVMGHTYEILPYAKDIIILRGTCGVCGEPSSCSFLKHDETNNKNDIIIGGNDKYIPMCHECYTQNIENSKK